MTLSCQDFGTQLAIGILADTREEVEEQFFSFYNHEATEGQLHWLIEGAPHYLAYFWTDTHRLIRALVIAALWELINTAAERYKGKRGGALPDAWQIGERRFSEITQDRLL